MNHRRARSADDVPGRRGRGVRAAVAAAGVVVVATLALALALAGCDRLAPGSAGQASAGAASAANAGRAAAKFNAVDLTGAEYARDFHLPDPSGQVRSLADYRGRDVVVFFGYTHCPDACPTMLADLKAARQAMGPDGDKVQVVFVTVDPARDTPELMKAYAENFGPGVVGLRGDEAATKAIAKDYKVFYAQVPGKAPGEYTIDHSAGAYVYDPAGRLRLFMRSGTTPESMAEDLKALLKESGGTA